MLKDNIAYNSAGHCYFLEDGGEHGNQFIHNWGARIMPMVKPLLLSDNEASTFWVLHPNNTFLNNGKFLLILLFYSDRKNIRTNIFEYSKLTKR